MIVTGRAVCACTTGNMVAAARIIGRTSDVDRSISSGIAS
jgi:hypothetical protein